jgi:hypothetical protein
MDKLLKVLLINWYKSHIDPDFIIKATVSNICLYPFLSYLTYVLQLLEYVYFNLTNINILRQFSMQYTTLILTTT